MSSATQVTQAALPVDWRPHLLAKLGTPVRGSSPRPAGDPRFFNGNYIPWLTVASLTGIPDTQLTVKETASQLTQEGSLRSRVLNPNTLIIANSGATLGVAKILGIQCCANDGIAALINPRPDIDLRYLAYFINTQTTLLRDVVATGNGQPNLNTGLIGAINVPIPSTIDEQRKIVDTLSDMDALISSLDQLIAKKRDILQAAMQQLLTGQRRLPGFSDKWEVKRLGDVLRVRHGRDQKEVESVDGAYPILATGGEIGRTDVALYEKPSVLIGRKGTIDRPMYRDAPFWTVDTLFYTELGNRALAKFIYYRFLLIDWYSYNAASGVPSLNAATIENISIQLPDIVEQTAIATILADMDTELVTLEARRDKARQIKQGVMQELLTGRIRLV